jgi:hypothetical protein
MIPKEVRDLGIGELDVEVLSDTWVSPIKRKFYPGKNVPVDRAYKNLAALGFIKWTQAHPHQTSLSDDRYLVTNAGRDVLHIVQGAARALSKKAKKKRVYKAWTAQYSNEGFTRAQQLADELTDEDRKAGREAPSHGYSAANFKRAERIVRQTSYTGVDVEY